jgi:hypothetical protein
MKYRELMFVTADLAGIFQGGVPPVGMEEGARFNSLYSDFLKIIETLKNTPATTPVNDETIAFFKDMVAGVKLVDNNIIDTQVGLLTDAYKDLIAQDPERWESMKKKVLSQITVGDEPSGLPNIQPGGETAGMNEQQIKLYNWAIKNPNDERSKQVLDKLNVEKNKGIESSIDVLMNGVWGTKTRPWENKTSAKIGEWYKDEKGNILQMPAPKPSKRKNPLGI